jgi:transposase-like protein
LLSTRCSTCHSPQRGQTTKKTRAEWDETVTRMIGKGVKLSSAERTVLVDHLAKITAS